MYPEELEPRGSEVPQEPIPFYYNKANQSIPLVPWNRFVDTLLSSSFFSPLFLLLTSTHP